MIKKIMHTAVIGGALLGLTAGANAETINVNIYGASAQYEFWTAAAKTFLEDEGCYTTVQTAKDTGNKHGIAYCEHMDNAAGDTVVIRYSSKASYDGIRAVQGLDPDGESGTCANNERLMASIPTSWSSGTTTADSCQDVTLGASDVAADTFGQASYGALYGPKTGGAWTEREIYNITMDDSYNIYRPIVVPFAFFANADEDSPVPFDNMSRLMATAIFSGQVTDWNQFDPSEDSMPIIVCMRHAGSGTHATLDAAVMRGDYPLMQTEALPTSFEVEYGIQPETYFNDGSSDMMRCVGGGGTTSGYDDYDGIGAIGYADADKVTMDSTGVSDTTSYGRVKLMTWQGEEAVKSNIVNGKYDFWSAQWLYSSPSEDEDTQDLIDDLIAFASDSSTLSTYLSTKAAYWATQDEMMVEKTTDFTYPSFK